MLCRTASTESTKRNQLQWSLGVVIFARTTEGFGGKSGSEIDDLNPNGLSFLCAYLFHGCMQQIIMNGEASADMSDLEPFPIRMGGGGGR